jgi:tungstate transport system permease protein
MIGLIFYGLLSRRGVFGDFGLLYTETAVIIGEASLILPIIINMCVVAVQSADSRLMAISAATVVAISAIFKDVQTIR